MLWANLFYEDTASGILLRAMPLMLGILCILMLAYRYYSAFLAAKVMALDDAQTTPAHLLNDGQNYHPTNKWVLFGHHFAAISGAGPLIGPVLALEYGYFPGLLWLVVGVCLAGAVQDMLVLAASVRRGGKSLAEIARTELGPWASWIVTLAILFIVIIALAGLGIVVVKALGGEEVGLAPGVQIVLPGQTVPQAEGQEHAYRFPPGCKLRDSKYGLESSRSEAFVLQFPAEQKPTVQDWQFLWLPPERIVTLPAGTKQLIPGSSWGMFTIACTIPIALFVSWYMYRFRKGKILEASLIGAVGVLGATVAGNWIPGSALEPFFSLTRGQTTAALCLYGFIASVLPVWVLLCPRDYISSFLKIGTIAVLILGVLVANPRLECPPLKYPFLDRSPTFQAGGVFPFVCICIMCGAISGFHALVSSGTTPKMIDKETHIRPIGYGAMLMEGLVGIVALISAAAMPVQLYDDINIPIDKRGNYEKELQQIYQQLPPGEPRINLAQAETMVGGESLRGRTGGAVTLAVGMALIMQEALGWTGWDPHALMKYWYHFAIMFEALFILTTIDTGTRIARFLMQEMLGRLHPRFERTDWLPGAILATLVVTAGWGLLVFTGSIATIWPMFGIANQLLAVLALCLITTLLVNTGRSRFTPLTILPMLFVATTTLTAGTLMISRQFPALIDDGYAKLQQGNTAGWTPLLQGSLSLALALIVMVSVALVLLLALARWLGVWSGKLPVKTTP
jgi:carbon starvation protein